MGVCHYYRVPHSEFLSWSADDRDKAIWAWLRERTTCPQCGTRAEEWNPAQGGHHRAYLAEVQVCRGCQAIAQRSDALDDAQRDRGHHVVLKRNPNAAGEVVRGEQA